MDIPQLFFGKFTQYLSDLLYSLITYGISFAALGLLTGIFLVIMAKRKGLLRRPYSTWTVFAGINYVYVPILLATMGGFLGTIYGGHSCIGRFIDDHTDFLARNGQSYIAQILTIAPEIDWSTYQGKTLDEILADEMSKRNGAAPGSEKYEYFKVINQAVVSHALNEAGISTALRDPRMVLQEFEGRRLPGNAFIGMARVVHEYCDDFFAKQYLWVFGAFLPFLFFPVAEYGLFRVLVRQKIVPAPVAALRPVTREREVNRGSHLNQISPSSTDIVEHPDAGAVKLKEETVVDPPQPSVPLVATAQTASQASINPLPPPPPIAVEEGTTGATIGVLAPITSLQLAQLLKSSPASTAITYVLGGALLQLYGGSNSGGMSVFTAIFGFVIFYIGLGKLKEGLDMLGQSAVDLLRIAAIVGATSAVVGLVPPLKILASLGYVAVFVIQLLAYLKLGNSAALGVTGKSGANLLLVAMILGAVHALLALSLPIADLVAVPLGLAVLILVFFGWVQVQEGINGVTNSTNTKSFSDVQ